ncbi:MAG: RnfABCDGE type electron transport complex subunit D [Solobacterium sp.]|nr:RnfABCDGE type electron transport complex subunit D [Solobacterium sp.]MCH4205577.1 RnfABCDGE type electron transport complex subunit D [Solobacterium sp.]MCH4227088.1 RnfABCDGE type electron transport complex subunit D [Solobacterium sp.]MCH4282340.1 RnfABCDGE type electron transport complex subunit D [Solobacterium sp.]
MKISYRPSPNYRSEQSTTGIMWDVTFCLLAVLLFSIVWYSVSYGAMYGLRVFLMALFAVIAAEATEVIWFKATGKDWKEIFHSYGWVTALILVLITRLEVSYYAVIVATIVAIIFGKMVFGGFGQNIFNPAAFGEALIMNSFSASVASDISTGATPVTTIKSAGWIMDSSAFSAFLSQFGGLKSFFLGNYASVIGGSCALLLILCFLYLLWKKDIDWHLSVSYVVTIFVISGIVGLMKGAGFEYGLFNVISGGVLFGAVFMMTDPVSTPVTIGGRVVFGICTACLTLVIRWRSNLPDGVLFSILLMNMLTPAIDKAFSGNQIKNASAFMKRAVIISVIAIATAFFVGSMLAPKTSSTTAAVQENPAAEITDISVSEM